MLIWKRSELTQSLDSKLPLVKHEASQNKNSYKHFVIDMNKQLRQKETSLPPATHLLKTIVSKAV